MSPPSIDAPHVEPSNGPRVATLSWPTFFVCLALLVAIFIGLNPLWEPLTMDRMDENIWWSYYPIPLLVIVALAFEKKLGWGSFAIETLRMTFVKFAVTFLIANVLWGLFGAPGAVETEAVPQVDGDALGLFVPRDPPAPTPHDVAETGSIRGRVVDATGAPVASAFVYVSGGLDGMIFETPTDTLTLRHDGDTFSPSPAIVQTYQSVEFVAGDSALHTVRARRDGAARDLFNDALPPGTRKTIIFQHDYEVITLGCRVPEHDHPMSLLLAVSHPFAALTDADGHFALANVPARAVDVSAWSLGDDDAAQDDSTSLTVNAGDTSDVTFTLR